MIIQNNWRTPQGLGRILITLCIGLLVILIMAGLFVWMQRGSSAASLARPQILQKAIEYAQATSTGNVTQTTATQTTLGQVAGSSCTFLGRLVSSLTYSFGFDPHNLCDPNTVVWLVELHGTFRFQGATASYLEIVLDTQGNFIQANTGPLQP